MTLPNTGVALSLNDIHIEVNQRAIAAGVPLSSISGTGASLNDYDIRACLGGGFIKNATTISIQDFYGESLADYVEFRVYGARGGNYFTSAIGGYGGYVLWAGLMPKGTGSNFLYLQCGGFGDNTTDFRKGAGGGAASYVVYRDPDAGTGTEPYQILAVAGGGGGATSNTFGGAGGGDTIFIQFGSGTTVGPGADGSDFYLSNEGGTGGGQFSFGAGGAGGVGTYNGTAGQTWTSLTHGLTSTEIGGKGGKGGGSSGTGALGGETTNWNFFEGGAGGDATTASRRGGGGGGGGWGGGGGGAVSTLSSGSGGGGGGGSFVCENFDSGVDAVYNTLYARGQTGGAPAGWTQGRIEYYKNGALIFTAGEFFATRFGTYSFLPLTPP